MLAKRFFIKYFNDLTKICSSVCYSVHIPLKQLLKLLLRQVKVASLDLFLRAL